MVDNTITMDRWVTRLLIPFRLKTTVPTEQWDRQVVKALIGDGTKWTTTDFDNAYGKLAHSEYFNDISESAARFLFDGAGISGCHYFRLTEDYQKQAAAFFQQSHWYSSGIQEAEMPDPSRPSLRGLQRLATPLVDARVKSTVSSLRDHGIQLVLDPNGVELWISRMGVGVVSLTLRDPVSSALTAPELIELNHLLASGHRDLVLRPKDLHDETPSSASDRIQPSDPTALGLYAWISSLLSPLRSLNPDFAIRGLLHTSFRMAADAAGLSNDSLLRSTQHVVSHLAQSHPISHDGELETQSSCLAVEVNRMHLAAVDMTGAAHATLYDATKQDDPYNKQRCERIQYGYFACYLLATMQRLCLEECLRRASHLGNLQLSYEQRERHMASITSTRLEANFVQVSTRGNYQRFYERALHTVEAVRGMEMLASSVDTYHQQQKFREYRRELERAGLQAKRDRESREHEQHLQHRMHILEVFIVAVYSFEVAHIVAEVMHVGHGNVLAMSLLVVLLLTVLFTVWCIHRRPGHQVAPTFRNWHGWILVLGIFAIHGAFLAVNLYFSSGH